MLKKDKYETFILLKYRLNCITQCLINIVALESQHKF